MKFTCTKHGDYEVHEDDLAICSGLDACPRCCDEQRKRAVVYSAILHERYYQDAKWGPLENQNGHHIPTWLNCMHEELKEAWDELFTTGVVLSGMVSTDDAREACLLEVVQVAAVAMAMLEQLAPDDIAERVRKHREKKS